MRPNIFKTTNFFVALLTFYGGSMLKKFTALFLITAFTQVYAITPIQQSQAIADELNRTFDELNYKLNVEWDQKDPAVFDQTVQGFQDEISALQAQGLTTTDLMNHALEKIKDKQIQNDMNELAKVADENQMNPDEARAFIVSRLSSTYSHGASWSGSRLGVHTAIIVGAIIVILIVCHNRHHTTDTVPTTPTKPCIPKCHKKPYSFSSTSNECYDKSGFDFTSGSYDECAM